MMIKVIHVSAFALIAGLSACNSSTTDSAGGGGTPTPSGNGAPPGSSDPIFSEDNAALDGFDAVPQLVVDTLDPFITANTGATVSDAPAPPGTSFTGSMALRTSSGGEPTRFIDGDLVFEIDAGSGRIAGGYRDLTASTADGTSVSLTVQRPFSVTGDIDADNTFAIQARLSGAMTLDGSSEFVDAAMVGAFTGDDADGALGVVDGVTASQDLNGVFVADAD